MVFSPSSQSRFKDAEYVRFRTFLERSCGILLGENKNYLIDSRLRRIMRDHQLESLDALVSRIERSTADPLRQSVIDAMTTNETLWFRDRHPFEYLKEKLLLEYLRGADPNLRIWCAASSTGQEPYSISICLHEVKRQSPSLSKDFKILATDISRGVLDQAMQGCYEPLTLNRGMSQERLKQFFDQRNPTQWQVKPEIRQRIEFKPFNLKDSFVSLGRFDIVFCRNVLIYFSSELQADILRKIHGVLKPNGYLFLGGSETPRGLNDLFAARYYSPGVVYQKI